MTEREKMLHAKSYIDMLAESRNPLTGAELQSDTVMSDARIVRCLFYVSELIERLAYVCDEDGHLLSDAKPKRVRRRDIALLITPDLLAQVTPGAEALPISLFVNGISDTLSECVGEKISIPVIWITNWLVEAGYLRTVERTDGGRGKTEKVATALGEQMGIATIEDRYNGQPIHKNLYATQAQQLILDHLPQILAAHQ